MTKEIQHSTREDLQKPVSLVASAPQEDLVPSQQTAVAAPSSVKMRRSMGERVVDLIVYPFVNNFGVFAISVAATYLTHKGWPEPASGKALTPWKQKVGNALKRRGQLVEEFCTNKLNMGKDSADMSRMVFFSFADGTLVAPFVKLLEDRREQMASWFDKRFGNKDEKVIYKPEPKQTWGSVIKGRLLTSVIVVPTAVALDRTGLNDTLFSKPGHDFGVRIEQNMPKLKGRIERVFGKVDIPYLTKTVAFEAFYTSVCTAGLYFISRIIARRNMSKQEPLVTQAPAPVLLPAQETDNKRTEETPVVPLIPSTAVSQTTHHTRIITPAAQEIRA